MVLHLNKLESFSPKDVMSLWLKLAKWLWRRRFLNFINVFSRFRNDLPLEMDGSLHLNKFESSSPKGCFVPNLVEIGQVVLEKKILYFVDVLRLFQNYLLSEKGRALHLNKLDSPSPKDALCQVWLKLAQ